MKTSDEERGGKRENQLCRLHTGNAINSVERSKVIGHIVLL